MELTSYLRNACFETYRLSPDRASIFELAELPAASLLCHARFEMSGEKPKSLVTPLKEQLMAVRQAHELAMRNARGGVELPHALAHWDSV